MWNYLRTVACQSSYSTEEVFRSANTSSHVRWYVSKLGPLLLTKGAITPRRVARTSAYRVLINTSKIERVHLSIIHQRVPNVCLTHVKKRLLIVLMPYCQRSPNDFIPCVNAYQRVKRASNVCSTCMWHVSTGPNECVAIAQRSSTVLQACVYRTSRPCGVTMKVLKSNQLLSIYWE